MMRRLRALLLRVRGLWSSRRFEQELHEELQSDLACMVRDGVDSGLTPAEARRRAIVRMGGMEQTRQAVRERRMLPMIETAWRDVRFAARQLRMRLGFATTAVLMLALGVGASVAIFAFVQAALLRPLPYPEPQRLVWTTEIVEQMGPANLSFQDYEDWRRGASSFSSFAVWRWDGHLLQNGAGLAPVQSMRVSANFLATLGLAPMLGRDFTSGDNASGAGKVVMLSYGLWQQRFGGRRSLVGEAVHLDGEPYTVVGVLPKTFEFAPRGRVDMVVPVRPEGCELRRSCHSLNGVARLKPGVSVQAADAEVKRIAAVLERQYPDSNRGQGAVAMPLADEATRQIRPVLWVLLAGAALLFAIACTNVASLVLARADARRREFALRSALGATAGRLLRQFGAESALLVAVGTGLGLLGSLLAMRLLIAILPSEMQQSMPFLDQVGLNGPVLLFAGVEALVAGTLFVVVPMLRVRSAKLRAWLAEGTSGSGSLSWRRLGSQMVVLEVATAVVLLVGAGLLSRSLLRLLQVDLGFTPEHVATLGVFAPSGHFKTDAEQFAVQKAVADRLRVMPGVTSVGLGSLLPVSFNGNTDWIRFVGRPYDGHHIEINERSASPEYFQTLGVKLDRGRFFNDADTQGKTPVAIVNRTFAARYFPGEDAIGKQYGDTELTAKSIRQIVGVVDDLHEGALDAEMWPAEYLPLAQVVDNNVYVAARVAGDERAMLPELAKAARGVSPELGVSEEVTMLDRIHDSQSSILHRGAAWLAGAFAAVALLLCAVGLYGVVMYSVSLRTRELGVRVALGSPRRAIYGLVLREAGLLTAFGLVLGLVMAMGAASLLRAVLFHVSIWDAPTLTGVGLVLGAAALLASFLPAYRAATVDPALVLRTE